MLISRGCLWAFMKRGGCKFGDGKTRGCSFSKKGVCSFAVGTQAQRVSAPPPPQRAPASTTTTDAIRAVPVSAPGRNEASHVLHGPSTGGDASHR